MCVVCVGVCVCMCVECELEGCVAGVYVGEVSMWEESVVYARGVCI